MDGAGATKSGRPSLRVAASPYFSLFMAVRDAAGAQRSGTPERWCAAIRTHLTQRDHEVLAPLVTSQVTHAPDAILPFPDPPGQTLKDGLERVVAVEDDLVRDIHACLALGPTGDWSQAARDPRRWVRGYVVALARAWNAFRPVWQHAQSQLTAEAERVQVAVERGTGAEVLLDVLGGRGIAGGCLETASSDGTRRLFRTAEGGLTLMPLVAGSRASIVDDHAAALRHVGYPMRRLSGETPAMSAGPASLEALLGIPRARILRELERPSTNGGIAAALQTVPSAATHHLSALEAAGLVSRERAGRTMLVRRTARGDALLALYENG